MGKKKFIVPVDFVRPTGEFTEEPRDRKLVEFFRGSLDYSITATTIEEEQRNDLEDFPIPTSEAQMVIKVDSNAEMERRYMEDFREIKKMVVFGLILANRNPDGVFHEYGEFNHYGRSGQGDILPYAFVQLDNEGRINTYYQSDYETLSRNLGFYSKFGSRKLDVFEEILELLLVNQDQSLDEALIKLMIRIHTLSSVKGGQIYMNIICLFSCLENLFGYSQRKDLCENVAPLGKLNFVRNGIAHPDEYDLIRKSKKVIAVKHSHHGNKLNPPKKKELTIDDLEISRIILIDKILDKLEI